MDEKQQNQKTFKATVKRPSPVKEICRYTMNEVVIPQSKDALNKFFKSVINMGSDALSKGLDRAFYPDGSGPRNSSKSNSDGVRTYVPHTNYSTSVYKNDSRPKNSIGSRSSIDINDIAVDTEDEANELLGLLREEVDNYGKAKVATLYEHLRDENGNKIPTTFADFKYGWTDASRFDWHHEGGKVHLDLPKPINIESVN